MKKSVSLRENNKKQNIIEYEEQNEILKSSPAILFLELTRNCNLLCKMCRVNKKYYPEWNMSSKIINKVFEEIVPFVSMVDLRGWGESTILRGFLSILKRTISAGTKVRLVTNGMCISPELWKVLFSSDNTVTISIDAASAELFARLRGGSLSSIIQNIREGIYIKNKLGRGRNYFNTVVSRDNLLELPEIVRLGSSLKVDKIILFPLITKRTNRMHLCSAKNIIVPILKDLNKISNMLNVTIQLGASLDESLTVGSGLPSICTHPWSHVYVDYKGGVGFCDHLIGRNEFILGSLKDRSFKEIWNNIDFIKLRKSHVKAENSREIAGKYWPCTWCYHNRYIDFEYELYPSLKSKLISTENKKRLYINHKKAFPIYAFI